MRDTLERHQIAIYFGTVVVATVLALAVPGTAAWEVAINPAFICTDKVDHLNRLLVISAPTDQLQPI